MTKFVAGLKVFGVGALIIAVLTFFLTAGSYMNQISVNSDLIAKNKDHSVKTARTVQIAMNRAREAMEESARATESNKKTIETIESFQSALNEIKTELAVNNERSKSTRAALKDTKKMLENM